MGPLLSPQRVGDRLGRDPATRFEQLIQINAVDCDSGYFPLEASPLPLKVL